jgi:hypothetical protein
MKRLFFFGYAPAGKKAWPLGGLVEELEPLDVRHGVSTNLVTTPILSALCYLPPGEVPAVLDDARTNVLSAGAGGRRRFNVLTSLVESGNAALDAQVKQLFRRPPGGGGTAGGVPAEEEGGEEVEVAGGGTETFRPESDVGLVFNFWAVAALFSFLIQGRERWTKHELGTFAADLLQTAVRGVPDAFPRPSMVRGLIRVLPDRLLARLGLFFRLCMCEDWGKMTAVLTPFIQEQRRRWQEQLAERTRDAEISAAELAWVLSVVRSVVPHPHTEIYDRHNDVTNPSGLYQLVFMSCQDPADLLKGKIGGVGWPLFSRYVGEAIAKKLLG